MTDASQLSASTQPHLSSKTYFLRYVPPRKEIYKHVKYPKQNIGQDNSVNISKYTHAHSEIITSKMGHT
jgi:hypothetical protein